MLPEIAPPPHSARIECSTQILFLSPLNAADKPKNFCRATAKLPRLYAFLRLSTRFRQILPITSQQLKRAPTMAASKTRTVKNKHAGPKGGSGGASGGKGSGAKRSASDGVSKSKKPKGPIVSQQVKEKNRALLMRRPKKKTYTAEELGIPTLNMITPIGVEKPKGKKKGKVFVDDKVCWEISFFFSGDVSMLMMRCDVGEHDDNPVPRAGRKGRPHRVEDDQGPTDGGDSRGEENRGRQEGCREEGQAGGDQGLAAEEEKEKERGRRRRPQEHIADGHEGRQVVEEEGVVCVRLTCTLHQPVFFFFFGRMELGHTMNSDTVEYTA